MTSVNLSSTTPRAHLAIEIYGDREPLWRKDKLMRVAPRRDQLFAPLRCFSLTSSRGGILTRALVRRMEDLRRDDQLISPALLTLFPFACSRNQMKFFFCFWSRARRSIIHFVKWTCARNIFGHRAGRPIAGRRSLRVKAFLRHLSLAHAFWESFVLLCGMTRSLSSITIRHTCKRIRRTTLEMQQY